MTRPATLVLASSAEIIRVHPLRTLAASVLGPLRENPGALLALGSAGLSLALLGDFVTDDAAVTLRFSRQWVDGHGITWNAGEDPVEGYSNFLHVLLGAGALKIGLPALDTLRFAGQLSLVWLTFIVYLLGVELLGSRPFATLAAMLVGAHPSFAYWSSSGLETGLYPALAYTGMYATLQVRSARNLWPAPFFLLAALARPEGPVMCAIALLPPSLIALRTRRLTPLLRHAGWVGLFVVSYGIYFVWRLEYFGYLLPNSAYYKIGAGSGWYLVGEFARHTAATLTLACFADYRRLGVRGLILPVLIAIYVLGAYDMRDSVAQHHRLLLPAVPALTLLAASGLERIYLWTKSRASLQTLTPMLLAALLFVEFMVFLSARRSADRLNLRIDNRRRVAEFLLNHVPAQGTLAVDDVGVIGYLMPNRVIDVRGLNSEVWTHRYHGDAVGYGRYVMSEHPAAIVIGSSRFDEFDGKSPNADAVFAIARASGEYGEADVFRATYEDSYHYYVLLRRELVKAPPRVWDPPSKHASAKPARMVDHVFTRVRARLASAER